MAWVEHSSMGYENPLALTLTLTTRTWGLGLSVKQKRGQGRTLFFRILLGKWQWYFSLG
jgi:hypothetical protein